jgi:RNA polymerase sigma-70 factor, ECF subfamily
MFVQQGDRMDAELAGITTVIPSPGCAIGITREAFVRLVLEHQRRIYRILLPLVRDADAAENLTQEVFLRAFESRTSFRGEASVGTWLVRIALNLGRDHVRSRRPWFRRYPTRTAKPMDLANAASWIPDPGPAVDRVMMARERLAAVDAAVDRLPHRQRACFLLRFSEAMTLEEVALAMDLKVGTVKSHLARAVGAVRRRLTEWKEPCEDI